MGEGSCVCGPDSDASPDQARAVLRKFDELAGFVREIEEKSSAIKAIESRNDRFEKKCRHCAPISAGTCQKSDTPSSSSSSTENFRKA